MEAPSRNKLRRNKTLEKASRNKLRRKRVRRVVLKKFARGKDRFFGKRVRSSTYRFLRRRRRFFKKYRFTKRRRDFLRHLKYYSRARAVSSKSLTRSTRKLLKPTFYLPRRFKNNSRANRLYRLTRQHPTIRLKTKLIPQ